VIALTCPFEDGGGAVAAGSRTAAATTAAASCWLGWADDSAPVSVRLAEVSGVVVAGLAGFGKTMLVGHLLGQLAPSPAVQFVLIDGKGGPDYDRLFPRAWLSAKDDLTDVRDVLRQVHRLMVDRQGAIAKALASRSELAGAPSHRVNLSGDWWTCWQTSRGGVEDIRTQPVHLDQHDELIQIEATARGRPVEEGGYLWRGELRLWDNEILMGWYAASDGSVRSKGTMPLDGGSVSATTAISSPAGAAWPAPRKRPGSWSTS
jgi:hypothetical protein